MSYAYDNRMLTFNNNYEQEEKELNNEILTTEKEEKINAEYLESEKQITDFELDQYLNENKYLDKNHLCY